MYPMRSVHVSQSDQTTSAPGMPVVTSHAPAVTTRDPIGQAYYERKYQVEYLRHYFNANAMTSQPFRAEPGIISHNVHLHYDVTVKSRQRREMDVSHNSSTNPSSFGSCMYPYTSYPYQNWPMNYSLTSSPTDTRNHAVNALSMYSQRAESAMVNLGALSPPTSDEATRLTTPSPPVSLSPYLPDGYTDSPAMETLNPSLRSLVHVQPCNEVTKATHGCYDSVSPDNSTSMINQSPSHLLSTTGLCADSGYASPNHGQSEDEDKSLSVHEKKNQSGDSFEVQLQELSNVKFELLAPNIAPNAPIASNAPNDVRLELFTPEIALGGGENAEGGKTKGRIKKPDESFVEIISHAILAQPRERILLSEIYDYCTDMYDFFRESPPTWKNSIRHNLSINECFIKSTRAPNGKGSYWLIHPACVHDFRVGDFNRRRARNKIQEYMRSEIRANAHTRRLSQICDNYSYFWHSTPKRESSANGMEPMADLSSASQPIRCTQSQLDAPNTPNAPPLEGVALTHARFNRLPPSYELAPYSGPLRGGENSWPQREFTSSQKHARGQSGQTVYLL